MDHASQHTPGNAMSEPPVYMQSKEDEESIYQNFIEPNDVPNYIAPIPPRGPPLQPRVAQAPTYAAAASQLYKVPPPPKQLEPRMPAAPVAQPPPPKHLEPRMPAAPVAQPPPPIPASRPCLNVQPSMDAVSAHNMVSKLQQGVVVTVFSLKRKPESMHLVALPDLSLLQCVRSLKDPPEITVDLSRVQEIRCGRHSPDFEKFPEDANKEDRALFLVIFYGIEALPQTLSIAARKREDFEALVVGLRRLVDNVGKQTYQEQRQRWFQRQFYQIVHSTHGRKAGEKVSIKQLRTWLLRNSLKVSKKVILHILQQLRLGDPLRYGGFVSVISELMRVPAVKKKILPYVIVKDGVQCVTPGTFLNFLKQEQNEISATDADAQALMEQYLEGSSTHVPTRMVLDLTDFEDFLFSPCNSIWKPEFNTIHQPMNHPLTDYWIASSHNTYLIGNQFKGQSSEEMYARCLRMGCRSLELDCWDGSDGEPIITHGFTFTSKIKVADVLKVIKENAWQTSEQPLILSIENHLSLQQQCTFASLLKDIFGNELLTEPVVPNETKMPSPDQLKRKIIIKDKKLKAEGGTSDAGDQLGKKNAVKTGILQMKDADGKWYPVTFSLSDVSIFYSDEKKDDEEENVEEEIDYDEYFDECDSDEDEDDISYQPWYYGDIDMNEVKRLLRNYGRSGGASGAGAKPTTQQDGAFLIRDGRGGGYSLSLIWKGDVKHVRVRTCEENGVTLYTFGNEVWKASIAELVKYFRNHRLYICNEDTHLYLDKPVCKPMETLDEDWYRPFMNRFAAERLLQQIPQEGVFLVRGSSEPGCLCISFRQTKKISHFQIMKRGRTYVCGSYRFLSLPKMVEYFRRRPLYRKTKLTVAASNDLIVCLEDDDCALYGRFDYNDPAEIEECKRVSVRALYDFMGHETENEMSFTRGAIITNVKVEDKAWWKGDYMKQKQKAFPATYVQVIEDKEEKANASATGSSRGKEDKLDLRDLKLDNGPYVENNRTLYCFHISHPYYENPLEFGCQSLLQLEDWVIAIRDKQSRQDVWTQEQQRQQKNQKRAVQLSNLIVYCQAISFDHPGPKRFYNVSSLGEDKFSTDNDSQLQRSRQQFLRVYPKGSRLRSSNYDPVPMWTCGCQMVALNYQTPDLPMQLNQARFLTNGGCGYVLKPDFLRDPRYCMKDVQDMGIPSESKFITVNVIAGRNLCSDGRMMGVVRPFVVVEVIGLPLDNRKQRTKAVDEDNGLNPAWSDDVLKFDVSCPELAFIRFEVLSEVNDSKSTIAQGTFPVIGLRQGYRSVPLKNCYSESRDMSSLLIHIEMKSPKDAEEENLFKMLEATRRYRAELLAPDQDTKGEHIHSELLKAEQRILDYLKQRRSSEQ